MNKNEYYRLTLHYYPGCIASGCKPKIYQYGQSEPARPSSDCLEYYRPDVMEFENRPVREDMLKVIAFTWRSICYKEIDSILRTCEFPYLDHCFKLCETKFSDDAGNEIGKIVVEKVNVYVNDYHSIPTVGVTAATEVAMCFPKNRRDEIYDYIVKHENQIKEYYLHAKYNLKIDDFEVETAIRICLRRAGLMNSGPKNVKRKKVKR